MSYKCLLADVIFIKLSHCIMGMASYTYAPAAGPQVTHIANCDILYYMILLHFGCLQFMLSNRLHHQLN